MSTRSPGRSTRKTAIPVDNPVPDGPPVLHDVVEHDDAGDADLPDIKLHGQTRPLEEREARIARAAYRRAEQRGFNPGREIDDWLAAEKEIAAEDGTASPDGRDTREDLQR